MENRKKNKKVEKHKKDKYRGKNNSEHPKLRGTALAHTQKMETKTVNHRYHSLHVNPNIPMGIKQSEYNVTIFSVNVLCGGLRGLAERRRRVRNGSI